MTSPLRKFRVLPDLPEKLKSLQAIATNLWMTWHPDAIRLFITMDGDLWEKCMHNPVRMLGEISQEKLEELAADEGFLSELQHVHEAMEQYLNTVRSINDAHTTAVAYFSAEYGLNDTLPLYSGGLGILSGDHVKSASDLNLNFRAVGLMYQVGYFQQYLNQDGWQQDFYQVNDFYNMQVHEARDPDGKPVVIEIDLPGRRIALKAWQIHVGRVRIHLLDANIDGNGEADRKLTSQLYGGNIETRLQQEIILGIGGVRLLDRLGIAVDVVHMNEGHSAFAPFERARVLMKAHGLNFREAIGIARKSGVFTTHTAVQAGHDEFSPDLMRRYFEGYVAELGISMEEFLSYGRNRPENPIENFSMTVAAMRNSAFINGVSALHADVSKRMWRHLWRDVPFEHLPIQGITNGIHIPSWISMELNDLFERYLGSKWRERQDYRDAWEKVLNIPDPELWKVHEIRRRRLVSFTRQRQKRQLIAKGASNQTINESEEALNPDALTIGFARRFATYKRADLIFADPPRLLQILNDPKRPVQLIMAGKAHPQDQAGKELIKNIIHFVADNHLRQKVAFIEDYDINVARYLVQGVDVWLNNPLRPMEACGTSGMKAACNGVINFSVLDGWWDEAYDFKNGWAIGNREAYTDRHYQDEVESRAIYSILENDIVPLFYDRGADGLPREWIRMVKHSLLTIASHYNTNRMIKEYYYRFYKHAGENFRRLAADSCAAAREFERWKQKMAHSFPAVQVLNVQFEGGRSYKIGEHIPVQADLQLGQLQPSDIRVDIYSGLSGGEELAHSGIEPLAEAQKLADGNWRFSGAIPCGRTGSFGFRVRVTPSHAMMTDPYELGMVTWG
jgi:glycogen phosphorylase